MIKLHEELQFLTLPRSEGAVALFRQKPGHPLLSSRRGAIGTQFLRPGGVRDELDDFLEWLHARFVIPGGGISNRLLHTGSITGWQLQRQGAVDPPRLPRDSAA